MTLTLCLSPPDSFRPLSPTFVSYPSGNSVILSWMFAAIHAALTSSSLALGFAYFRLYMILALKRTVSCGTTPMFSLRLSSFRSLTSWSSMVMDPDEVS